MNPRNWPGNAPTESPHGQHGTTGITLCSLLAVLGLGGCFGPSLGEVKEEIRGNVERCMTRVARVASDDETHELLQSMADIASQWRRGQPAGDVSERLGLEERSVRFEEGARVAAEELGKLADRLFDEDTMGDEVDGKRVFRAPASILCEADLDRIADAFGVRSRFDVERCYRKTMEHTLTAYASQEGGGYFIELYWDDAVKPIGTLLVERNHFEVGFSMSELLKWLRRRFDIPNRFAKPRHTLDSDGGGRAVLEVSCPGRKEVQVGLRTTTPNTYFRLYDEARRYDYDRRYYRYRNYSIMTVRAAHPGAALRLTLRPGKAEAELVVPELHIKKTDLWRSDYDERIREGRFYDLSWRATLTPSGLRAEAPRYEHIELVDYDGAVVIELPSGRWPEASIPRTRPIVLIEGEAEVPIDFRFERALSDEAPPRILEHSRYVLRSARPLTSLGKGPRGRVRIVDGWLELSNEETGDTFLTERGTCFSLRGSYPQNVASIGELFRYERCE